MKENPVEAPAPAPVFKALAAAGLLTPFVAHGATITVNTTAVESGSVCTLRDAARNINDPGTAYGVCTPATAGSANTIVFGPSAAGTITYANTEDYGGAVTFTPRNDLTITGTTGPIVLPVTYSNFTARFTEANQVAVGWATSYEKDNAYFEVERSNDAVNFAQLGRVTGKGTTTGRQTYAFTDEAPGAGWNYYRLKQVDTDGTAAYSRPVAVLNVQSTDSQLTIYPNPANAEVNIRLKNAVQSASVIDTRGVRRSVPVSNSAISVADLVNGLYVLEVQTANGQTLRQRLVKQ